MKSNTKAVLNTAATICLPALIACIIMDVTNQTYATTFLLIAFSMIALIFAPVLYFVYGGK